MNPSEFRRTEDQHSGWRRISSFKRELVCFALTLAVSSSLLIALPNDGSTFFLVLGMLAVASGLILLKAKVVYKRENQYRISTLLHQEILTAQDVCMTVQSEGPWWTCLRIHLSRPSRFGWKVSFVALNEKERSK